MTTVQMNADVYRSLSIIAEDSDLMKRAMIYLRKLARQKQQDDATMTKEEFFSKIDKRMENYENGESMTKEEFFFFFYKRMENYENGEYVSFTSPEEMHSYFESL